MTERASTQTESHLEESQRRRELAGKIDPRPEAQAVTIGASILRAAAREIRAMDDEIDTLIGTGEAAIAERDAEIERLRSASSRALQAMLASADHVGGKRSAQAEYGEAIEDLDAVLDPAR